MSEPSTSGAVVPRLVILLNSDTGEALPTALRYAATAAAMDVAVELHIISAAIALLRMDAVEPAFHDQLRQAVSLGVEIFACPLALAERSLTSAELVAEVAGVRGAASLLVAGLAPGARFLVF